MENNYKEQALELLRKHIGDKYGTLTSMKPIHNGYTNHSWLVTYEKGVKLQVRIPHCGDLINRTNEALILRLIGDNTFIYFDEKTGCGIKKWIEGKCPKIHKHRKWPCIDDLFSQIRRLHAVKLPPNHRFKPINFDAYNENLYHLKFKYQTKYLSIVDTYRDEKLVVSHTDINAQNMILSEDGKLHLIDYEWCGLVSDYWDYANFIRESGITWYDKIDWSKYINHFEMNILKDFIFASCVFAYLWTWMMPQTSKIKKYRRITLKQIHLHARGVFDNEE